MRTRRRGDETRIVFSGTLTAADMGRLERACGDALTREQLLLKLDVRGVSVFDRTALALLDRLEHRGAVVIGRAPRGTASPDAAAPDDNGGTNRHGR